MNERIDYLGFEDLFVDDRHKNAFYACLESSRAKSTDVERQSLFFILTHNRFLRENIDNIYDFFGDGIFLEKYENGNTYSSGENAVIQLAFNLFNSYGDTDVCSLFSSIDITSFEVCINAIRIRFGRLNEDYEKYSRFQQRINRVTYGDD